MRAGGQNMCGKLGIKKICNTCALEKYLDDFHVNKGAKYGVSNTCKICANKRTKENYLNNKSRCLESGKLWAKNNPEKTKASAKKYKDKIREKLREARRERYLKNKDKEIANCKKWQSLNKEKFLHSMNLSKTKRRHKIKETKDKITLEQWENIKSKAKNKCHYCKKVFEKLTMDHVIPLSKGGNHNQSNIVPACQSCNSKKGNKIQVIL